VLIMRGAELVWDGIDEVPGGAVVCGGGVVVESSVDGAVELDASGCVVTPGLVNAHHHLLQTAFRTLPGTGACRCGTGRRAWRPRTQPSGSTTSRRTPPRPRAWPRRSCVA
jgi:cytosine/adenosine deaminase-related metal-dependent hydrolase